MLTNQIDINLASIWISLKNSQLIRRCKAHFSSKGQIIFCISCFVSPHYLGCVSFSTLIRIE